MTRRPGQVDPDPSSEAQPDPDEASAEKAAKVQASVPGDTNQPWQGGGGGENTLEDLKYQDVVVHAGGITYRGMLLGADEEELYLRTSLRYVTVRMDRISKLARADANIGFDRTKQVDPSFYNLDDLQSSEDEP